MTVLSSQSAALWESWAGTLWLADLFGFAVVALLLLLGG
jgi:hypothetical protein